jgi:outer membrane lipase/esterase
LSWLRLRETIGRSGTVWRLAMGRPSTIDQELCMKSFQRSILAAALAFAALPAAAQTYSQTVFFGDSLTDPGFFRPVLPPSAQPVTGRFTTNPGLVWAEFLADYYGTNAGSAWQLTPTGLVNGTGTNFAAGGARVATPGGFPPTQPIVNAPPLSSQVGAYLARNGGAADPNALYSVWGGANDLFYHLNGLTTQATFLAAAGQQVGLVSTLAGAGARYILVPTMPDVGATPFGLSLGAAGSAGVTALVNGYNQTLFGTLDAAGLRVIPLDTFNFLHEVIADPGAYGFSNATGTACVGVPSSLICNPTSLAAPNAPETYVFADGVHPTTATHRMMAQYASSILEAPRQIAVLPQSAAMVGNARAERVAAQLEEKHEDGMRWWADVRGDSQRYPDSGTTDGYDGGGASLSAGVSWTRGDLVYGGFGGYGRQSIDFWAQRGEFDQTDATLGGFAGWRHDALWVNGQLSYTWLGYDVEREVHLGPATRVHDGSPDGSNLSAGFSAGWDLEHGKLTHGPVLRLLSQQIDVDGYTEAGTQSTALAYPDQAYDSLIGSVGWQASVALQEHLHPYARLSYEKEFEEPAEEAFAQLVSMPGTAPYAVPGLHYDHNFGVMQFGARTELFGLDADIGMAVTVGQKGGNNASVYLSVGSQF